MPPGRISFCFLQHIHSSAFPHVNPNADFPSAEGSLRDELAETCYFYAQNLPTIVTLLPRAGLALALLLCFFSPENLPGGTQPLGPTINILFTFSATLGEGIGLVRNLVHLHECSLKSRFQPVSPANTIFTRISA